MSTKIRDILKLPCMHGARVVAGAKHIDQTITSITVMQVFADAIYATQRRQSELGIDLYNVLSGKVSMDEYRAALEKYFVAINRRNPDYNARNYANCTKQLKEFMEQADLI